MSGSNNAHNLGYGEDYSVFQKALTNVDQHSNQLDITDKDIQYRQHLIAFRHTFSHYHLDITPILVDLSKQPDIVMEGNKVFGITYHNRKR